MSVKVWKKNPIYHDGVHTSDPTYNTPGWDEIISGRTPNYDFDNECFDRDGDSISLSDDIKGKLDKITIDTTPVEGDVLTWDETAGAFIPEAPEGGGDAEDIAYNNATSGLAADDVQDAIDEVTEKLANINGIVDDACEQWTVGHTYGSTVKYVFDGNAVWNYIGTSATVADATNRPSNGAQSSTYWEKVNISSLKSALSDKILIKTYTYQISSISANESKTIKVEDINSEISQIMSTQGYLIAAVTPMSASITLVAFVQRAGGILYIVTRNFDTSSRTNVEMSVRIMFVK